MRVARVGFLFMIGAVSALALPGAAPATTTDATPAANPSFKVSISPEYTTAGQSTTFRIAVVNTSPQGTTLGSVQITPPKGFSSPHPTLGSPLRRRTKVQNRTVMVHQISVDPGKRAKISVTAIAPD